MTGKEHPLHTFPSNFLCAGQCGERYSLFLYMEDDLLLTWQALQAWAEDEVALAPLGFHRGLVRVETSQWDGRLMAFDQRWPTPVDSPGARVISLNATYNGSHTHGELRKRKSFAQLQNPYMAMWLASSAQLGHWMTAPEWGYLPHTMSDLIREEAAWSVYSIESAEYKRGGNGFQRSLVWPYDPVAMKLDHIAEVFHIPNNKCKGPLPPQKGSGAPCTISFDEVLTH